MTALPPQSRLRLTPECHRGLGFCVGPAPALTPSHSCQPLGHGADDRSVPAQEFTVSPPHGYAMEVVGPLWLGESNPSNACDHRGQDAERYAVRDARCSSGRASPFSRRMGTKATAMIP